MRPFYYFFYALPRWTGIVPLVLITILSVVSVRVAFEVTPELAGNAMANTPLVMGISMVSAIVACLFMWVLITIIAYVIGHMSNPEGGEGVGNFFLLAGWPWIISAIETCINLVMIENGTPLTSVPMLVFSALMDFCVYGFLAVIVKYYFNVTNLRAFFAVLLPLLFTLFSLIKGIAAA